MNASECKIANLDKCESAAATDAADFVRIAGECRIERHHFAGGVLFFDGFSPRTGTTSAARLNLKAAGFRFVRLRFCEAQWIR